MSSFDSYTTVKNLFIIGTTVSAFTSGGLLFTSYLHAPAYISNPSDESLAKQWKIMFSSAQVTTPPLALIAGGCHLLNAYHTHTQPQSLRFLGAGLLSMAVVPWNLLAMVPSNNELMARADGKPGLESQKGKSTKELVTAWGTISAVRGWLMLAGTILGFDAMLHLSF